MATTKRTIKQDYLGTHVIAEIFGCQKIDNLSFIRAALIGAAQVCGATVLHTKFHRFSPQGITGYVLLAESHISIHTWPEYDYAAVDIFTCGKNMDAQKAVSYLKKQLQAQKIEFKEIMRGDLNVSPESGILNEERTEKFKNMKKLTNEILGALKFWNLSQKKSNRIK